MFVMLVGPSDDIMESKTVTGPNLKLQRGSSSPLRPMLATPLHNNRNHSIDPKGLTNNYVYINNTNVFFS